MKYPIVRIERSDRCSSAGDALRDLDSKVGGKALSEDATLGISPMFFVLFPSLPHLLVLRVVM